MPLQQSPETFNIYFLILQFQLFYCRKPLKSFEYCILEVLPPPTHPPSQPPIFLILLSGSIIHVLKFKRRLKYLPFIISSFFNIAIISSSRILKYFNKEIFKYNASKNVIPLSFYLIFSLAVLSQLIP